MAPNLSEDEIDDLIYLARTGEDTELTQLLQALADREKVSVAEVLQAARDEGGSTCLHMAAANGHSRTVTHILSQLPPSSTPSPTTPSTSSSSQTPTPSSQTLQSSSETPYINVPNSFGNTALHWACLGGHLDTIQLLLSRGANPAAVNDKDQIPLDLAAFNNHMDVVEYFLSQSGDKEAENAKQGAMGKGIEDVGMDVEMDDGEEGEKVGDEGRGGS